MNAQHTIETRIGKLEFTHDFGSGYPTDETVAKLYEERDFQRACQLYLWAIPLVSFAQWQYVHENVFGAGNGGVVIYNNYRDKLGLMTANATTPYILSFVDLARTGPVVVDVPEGKIAGGIASFWQVEGTEITGSGKYLLLGPGQEQTPGDEYTLLRSDTMNAFLGFRILDTDPQVGKTILDNFHIYPYSQRDNPPLTRKVTPEGKPWLGAQPRGITYWERLADIIERETVHEHDRFMMAMLKSIGIENGKPFQPDEKRKAILEQASLVGEAMAKANDFDKRMENAQYAPNRHWHWATVSNPDQRAENYDQLDERAAWFYEAVGNASAMQSRTPGFGQNYLGTYKDKDGDWLDGGQTYRLHVPPNPPEKQFWSVTAYDVDTRCFIDNEHEIADRSSRMDLDTNDDGSVDIYLGPKPPEGKEKNWIPTVPGRGWFAYFRMYAPLEPFWDGTWSLPDFEKVK